MLPDFWRERPGLNIQYLELVLVMQLLMNSTSRDQRFSADPKDATRRASHDRENMSKLKFAGINPWHTVGQVKYALLRCLINPSEPCPAQDSPSGHSLHVQSCKNDGKAGLCLKCYYIKRGSFAGLRLQEFAILLKENGSLKDKFLVCFSQHSVRESL